MAYDYVIAGGGAAGAVLAARLSEDPAVSVCLLEAGGSAKHIFVRAPAGAVALLPGYFKGNNWAFNTVPQAGLNGRKGYQPRGKGLGGSSAINAMLYLRGHRSDYDRWAALGNAGWGFSDVLPYFIKSEGNARGASLLHGGSGPLQVCDQQSPRPITEAFVQAAEQMQHRRNDDFNGPTQEGVGHYQVTQFYGGAKNGERCSVAAAYLEPVRGRANLTVLTHAQVARVLFEGKRAVGVRYIANGKVEKTVQARREVIVAGGTFGSPQILQRSGVGRHEDIVPHGLKMVHELRGVGQNLQDHLDTTLSYKSKDSDLFGIGVKGTLNLMRHIWNWRKTGKGLVATPFAEGAGFLKTNPALSKPDIQLHFVVAVVDDHARKLHMGYGFSCHVCTLRPFSRGHVSLNDADPRSPPKIDPCYLSDPRDMETALKAVKMAREILQAPALAPYRHKELGTGPNMTDPQWQAYIRATSDTIYHPVGTCKMGVDALAVVDPALRVHGLEGLRVVDASIMPELVGGNTNAPTVMIAEKAADMIKASGPPALGA